MSARARRQSVWVLLGVIALAFSGAAASALAGSPCCPGMEMAGTPGCASLASSSCCGDPAAVPATAETPAAWAPAVPASDWPAARPLPARSTLQGSRPGSGALIRTVVLRL